MLKAKFPGLKTSLCLTLCAVFLFTQSCKKSDSTPEESISPEELQQLKTFVSSSTGLPLSSVEYKAAKKHFVAGKDVLIKLADVQTRLANTEISPGTVAGENQRIYMYTVDFTKVANIAIYADNSVPGDWMAALDQAIINWNNTNSRVLMKRVTATTTTTTTGKGKKKSTTTVTVPPAYNVLVTTFNDASTSTVAQAYLPYADGSAGHEVDINTYYNYLSSSYKIFTLTHELGHSIGFTHTNGTYGNLIPGTPTTDPNSVMNSFILPWNSFTPYDITAVTTIYPK